MSYVPRLAKVVNVLSIRQVKQGTETTGFRIGFTLRLCTRVNMLALDLIQQFMKGALANHQFTHV